MGFSSEVREELSEQNVKSLHCRIAMLAGIITLDAKMKREEQGRVLAIRMEQDVLVKCVKKLLEQIFGFREEDYTVIPRSSTGARLRIEDSERIDRVLQTLKLRIQDDRLDVDDIVFTRSCCRGSFLKGAYLAAGSVSNPESAYQLEIVTGRESVTGQLVRILAGFGLTGHTILRRGNLLVYLKGAGDISELLGIMGAGNAMMELENVRILKEIRNTVNREVNCDTANITKITVAASRDAEQIRKVEETIGLSSLPPELQETARLRMEQPELSLSELGERLVPPLGKSGVNHRLRKIRKIAADPDSYRGVLKKRG